jgi:hypothetical protein
MDQIRANTVQVAKHHRAECQRPTCIWQGDLLPSYAAANAQREGHLAYHRVGGTDIGLPHQAGYRPGGRDV